MHDRSLPPGDTPQRQLPWQTEIAVPLPAGVFKPWEEWAWARIIRGFKADMRFFPRDDPAKQATGANAHKPDEGGDDPKAAANWPPHRTLSAAFMHTILFHDPWASAKARPVVAISCARTLEELNWNNEKSSAEISLMRCLFHRDLGWSDLDVDIGVALSGSRLEGELNGDGLRTKASLFCDEGFQACGDVRLIGAKIGRSLYFEDATLDMSLVAIGLVVEDFLYLREMKKLHDANLAGARIGGDLQLVGSNIVGTVDLTGAEIKGEINLAQRRGDEPKWDEGAQLVLRNAKAGALAGGLDAFRRGRSFVHCEMAGFSYERLGGIGAGTETGSTLARASSTDLRRWLRYCCPPKAGFEPGPHHTLAKALADAGYPDKAADIRNELGNHELAARGVSLGRRLLLMLSWLFIGYGQRNHRAVIAFALLVALGAHVGYRADLMFAPPGPEGWRDQEAWLDWMGFAFGSAIPLVVLDATHATFLIDRFCGEVTEGTGCTYSVPSGLVGFFYSVKVVGFVILSYLAAGLTGIAQRKD